MMRDGLDLVVEDVSVPVDFLAADRGFEREAVVGNLWLEHREQDVLGLATKNQLVEPADEQVGRRFGLEAQRFGQDDLDRLAVGDHVVEQPFGAGPEQAGEVVRRDPEPNIGRVVKDLDRSHFRVRLKK
jgi:hypothetical protein